MTHSAALISTEELARKLGAPGLRLFDCTTYLRPRTDGQPGYISESGRANYDKGHLPGAAFLDLAGELSDTSSKLRYTLPSLDQLEPVLDEGGPLSHRPLGIAPDLARALVKELM